MDIAALDREITAHALGVLLRYFRQVGASSAFRPQFDLERDCEMLRLHWAFSQPVRDLVEYTLTHAHEVRTVLQSELRIEDGFARGRVDAIKTINLRRVSGLPTLVVSQEPVRSYNSGPNHVLGWVLMQAYSLASRFSALALDSAAFQEMIEGALQRMEQTRRMQAVAAVTANIRLANRPTANALIQASRTRHKIYSLATGAYRHLLAVEAGDEDAIAAVLQETLLVPLEPWRRFEIAVGLSALEALEAKCKIPMNLKLLTSSNRLIGSVGDHDVFWQERTSYYADPIPEPSDMVVEGILAAFGFKKSSDRPDIVVTNRALDRLEAIIEVKYLTAEDASDRVRSAVGQLVRYARGYQPLNEAGPLLSRCLIAVSQGLDGLSREPAEGVPLAIEFSEIKRGLLASWAERLSA